MHFVNKAIIVVALISIGSSEGRGDLTATFTPASLTSAQRANAVADDTTGFLAANGGAADFRSFDLSVVVPPGEENAGVGLLVMLTQGQMFQATFEQPDPSDPMPAPDLRVAQPGFWVFAPNRDLRVDTFITTPAGGAFGFGPPLVHGRYSPGGAPGTEVFTGTQLNLAYGELTAQGAGTFIIARISLSLDAAGTVSGELGSSVNPMETYLFSFTIIPVPEPIGMSLIAGAALLLSRRRKLSRDRVL